MLLHQFCLWILCNYLLRLYVIKSRMRRRFNYLTRRRQRKHNFLKKFLKETRKAYNTVCIWNGMCLLLQNAGGDQAVKQKRVTITPKQVMESFRNSVLLTRGTRAHSLTHSPTQIYSFTHSLSHLLTFTHAFAPSLSHSHSFSLSHSLIYLFTLTQSLTHCHLPLHSHPL